MENAKNLLDVCNKYLLHYPTETTRLAEFKSFISTFNGRQLYNRHNFTGHITASAIVVNADDLTVLLLEHKKLNRWLQPGGHVDANDKSILHAALRELYEETGISAGLVRLVTASDGLPLDIDSHLIPANVKRQEPGHYHHDLKYLFVYTGPAQITLEKNESLNYKWEPLDTVVAGNALNGCIDKIQRISLNRAEAVTYTIPYQGKM